MLHFNKNSILAKNTHFDKKLNLAKSDFSLNHDLLLKFSKDHPKGENGSQNDQETIVYRAIWDKGRRRSKKLILDE